MEMLVVGYVAVAFLGLVFGSFAGATVWRLRARQLVQDKKDGEPVNSAELKKLKPLTTVSVSDDRSRCLHCGHELHAKDLLPLVSWLSTKGRCRYCKRSIGRFEPLIEVGMAIAFVAMFAAWLNVYDFTAVNVVLLIGGFAVTVLLGILFAYDARWFILPDKIVFPLIAIGTSYAIYSIATTSEPLQVAAYTIGSVVILGGLYLGLWLLSKGAWVGFGDVKLGLGLGLLLVDWRLAFLTLFLANFIGTLIVLPGLITKRIGRQTQIPFGPLLIAGFAISALYGVYIIDGYEQFSMWLLDVTLMV